MNVGTLKIVCEAASYEVPTSLASLIMRHVLLMGIAPENTAFLHWFGETEEFIRQFKIKMKKGAGRKTTYNKTLMRKLEDSWDKCYRDAVRSAYGEEKQTNNPIHFNRIPEVCPWTIDEFLAEPTKIGFLINKVTNNGGLINGTGY